jgi:hypothetical protein
MKKTNFFVLAAGCAVILLAISVTFAQKAAKPKPKPAAKQIVFAVMGDGKTLEPIGVIDKGELTATTGGDGEAKALKTFVGAYYKPKTSYNLIFGGAANGTVTVQKSNAESECGKNLADVTFVSPKAKLKGFVMALATSKTPPKSAASGVRRLPTFPERGEIESLVRAEFGKQGITASALKTMNYHNLTALDVDNDGKAEMVGSFWVENSPTERGLLFFIAEKNSDGKYTLGYSDYSKASANELIGGAEIKDVDAGRLHELLLDVMEYDGDSTAEIFTVTQAFEGNNFNV